MEKKNLPDFGSIDFSHSSSSTLMFTFVVFFCSVVKKTFLFQIKFLWRFLQIPYYFYLPPRRLLNFERFRCGAYSRAALNRGRRLFKILTETTMKKFYLPHSSSFYLKTVQCQYHIFLSLHFITLFSSISIISLMFFVSISYYFEKASRK